MLFYRIPQALQLQRMVNINLIIDQISLVNSFCETFDVLEYIQPDGQKPGTSKGTEGDHLDGDDDDDDDDDGLSEPTSSSGTEGDGRFKYIQTKIAISVSH